MFWGNVMCLDLLVRVEPLRCVWNDATNSGTEWNRQNSGLHEILTVGWQGQEENARPRPLRIYHFEVDIKLHKHPFILLILIIFKKCQLEEIQYKAFESVPSGIVTQRWPLPITPTQVSMYEDVERKKRCALTEVQSHCTHCLSVLNHLI